MNSQADPLMWEDPEAFDDPPEPHDDEDFYNPEGEETMSGERQEYVQGLRDLADAIEKSGFGDDVWLYGLRLDIFADTTEKQREISTQLGGMREKIMEGGYAIVRRNFGPHKIDINVRREKVCQKVQTGERFIPAREATTEPVFEWVCEDETWVPAA